MSDDTFGRFYAAVNAEWPQYGMTEDEANAQERRWRAVLGQFSDQALGHAMKQALRGARKRPRAAELVEWAQEAQRRSVPPERLLPHASRCSCGCGGQRWYLVLRDEAGRIRHYAPTVEEMTARLPHQVAAAPAVAKELAALAGQPMLRAKCECRRGGGDPLPMEAYRIGTEEGMPVYDTMRRAVADVA